ncbi:hypothetical protein GF325_13085 [Candidatus Bathyarchaeota archaeon]|nr:hypothetical protein [Candidatus Bathyarchaeota archaeon]
MSIHERQFDLVFEPMAGGTFDNGYHLFQYLFSLSNAQALPWIAWIAGTWFSSMMMIRAHRKKRQASGIEGGEPGNSHA